VVIGHEISHGLTDGEGAKFDRAGAAEGLVGRPRTEALLKKRRRAWRRQLTAISSNRISTTMEAGFGRELGDLAGRQRSRILLSRKRSKASAPDSGRIYADQQFVHCCGDNGAAMRSSEHRGRWAGDRSPDFEVPCDRARYELARICRGVAARKIGMVRPPGERCEVW